MREPWWSPVFHFAQNTLSYAALFAFLVLGAVYGSAITAFAAHLVTSKFIFHVIVFMEYAAVVGDALFILTHLMKHLVEGIRRVVK